MQIKWQLKLRSWWRTAAIAAAAMIATAAMSPSLAYGQPGQPRQWIVLGRGENWAPGVRAVQYLLREHGHSLTVDGRYGSRTRESVRRFQRARGLKESGVVDGATWERLVIPVRRGSRGNAVRAVQNLLRSLPYEGYSVALDGVFSAQTERAVRRFQKFNDIAADGLVGPVTWELLLGPQSD